MVNERVAVVDAASKKFVDDDVVAALAQDPRFARTDSGGGTPPVTSTDRIVLTEVPVDEGVPAATQWNPTQQTGSADAQWSKALDLSNSTGLPIWVPPGRWPVTATKTDISVRVMKSPGTLIQRKGESVLKLTHNVGAPIDAPVRHIWVTSNDTENPQQCYAVLDVTPAAMAANTPNQGDAFFLTSSLILPGDFIGDGENTFAAEWVTVAGVGMNVTHASPNGVISGINIVGTDSRATASVAVHTTSAGQTLVILNNVVGVFRNGETVTTPEGVVRGTVTSDPYIVATKALTHAHAGNSPKLRKGRTDLTVDIDGLRIDTATSTDDITIPAASRKPALELNGLVGPNLNTHFLSSYKAAILLGACYKVHSTMRITKLPGYATDAQGAWGYGLVLMGACDNIAAQYPYAENFRHAITSNIRPTISVPTAMEYILNQGVSKYVTVSGNFYNSTDDAIDQHGGSMFWTVKDAYIGWTGAVGRPQARAAGIQNRGFGLTVENVVIDGAVDGIRDISAFWPTSQPTTNIYRNVTFRNIKRYAVNMLAGSLGAQTNGKTKTIIDRPVVSIDNRYSNPNAKQGLVSIDVGNVEIIEPHVSGVKNSPGYFGVEGRPTRPDSVLIRGGMVDWTDNTATTMRGWQIQSTAAIPYFGIFDHKFNGSAASMIRVGAPSQVVFTDGCYNMASTSTLPFATTYTPADQPGTSNDLNPATVNASVAPVAGSYTISGTKVTGSVINAQGTWPGATVSAGAFAAPFAITATNARIGDYVQAVTSNTMPAGVAIVSAAVTADDTVTVLIQNTNATGTTDVVVPSKTIRVRVSK